MIIFGTTGITSRVGSGSFHCPACGRQGYTQKRVRRFFTLYFIPVIPLDEVGRYVQCAGCRQKFEPSVLSYDPEAERRRLDARLRDVVRRVMVEVMLADGAIDDAEVEAIRTVHHRILGVEVSREDVERDARVARGNGRGIAQLLAPIAGSLSDAGKEMVLRAALCVAAADGEVGDCEREQLSVVALSLGMSREHVHGIVQQLAEPVPVAS